MYDKLPFIPNRREVLYIRCKHLDPFNFVKEKEKNIYTSLFIYVYVYK